MVYPAICFTIFFQGGFWVQTLMITEWVQESDWGHLSNTSSDIRFSGVIGVASLGIGFLLAGLGETFQESPSDGAVYCSSALLARAIRIITLPYRDGLSRKCLTAPITMWQSTRPKRPRVKALWLLIIKEECGNGSLDVLWLNFRFIRSAEYTGKYYFILSSYFAGKTLKQKR